MLKNMGQESAGVPISKRKKAIILLLCAAMVCCAVLSCFALFADFTKTSRAYAEEPTETGEVQNLTVEWQAENSVVDYDGNPHGYTATVTGFDVTVQYCLKGGTSWSTAQPTEAGEYEVRAVLSEPNPAYNIPESENRTLVINALPVHVRWQSDGSRTDAVNGLHWIYDGEIHKLTATLDGLIVKDTADGRVEAAVTFAVGSDVGIDQSSETLVPCNADTYTAFAKLTGAASNNYYIVNSSEQAVDCAFQTYKITQRSVVVNWAKNVLNGTYTWVYSGFSDETAMQCTLETSAESATGYSGVIAKDSVTPNVTYASVQGGVVGAYDGTVRLNVGAYVAKATITDANYVLSNAELNYNIVAREVRVEWNGVGAVGKENDVIIWQYDGASHLPVASAKLPATGDGAVSGGVQLDEYIAVTGAESEVTALSSKSIYEACATLGSHVVDGFDVCSNFTLTNDRVNFRIDRAVIVADDVSWYNGDGEEITGAPTYTWGTVKGNGPIFTAQAVKEISDGAGGTLTLTFDLSVSNPDAANYQPDVNWVVNESVGYKSVASLTGATVSGGENVNRFEFLTDGVTSNSTYIKFFIRAKAGEKEPIDVKWVVFSDNSTYHTLSDLSKLGGVEITNGGGYVSVENGKFAFVFNGANQSPVAIYEYSKPNADGELYEILPINAVSSINSGDYILSLAPSSKYDYSEENSECRYTIKPLVLKLDWGETTFVYNGKERVPAPVIDSAYLAAQPDWYKNLISSMTRGGGLLANITATGATDAGTYDSECNLSNDFSYADNTGKAKITIKPFAVVVSAIDWDFTGAKNATQAADGTVADNDAWYWVYDGELHSPVPTLTVRLDSSTSVTLTLLTTGAATNIGSHTAFAWLDTTDANNKNFILVESSGSTVSVIASRKFSIAKRTINAVYWEGYVPDGATEELKKDGVLAYSYDGSAWAPKAYYLSEESTKVYLTVEGGMKNAGRYSARITNDFDFKDESGKPVSTECEFVILSRVINVEWQGNADNENKFVWTYNGLEQKPTVGFDEEQVVAGDDIGLSVTGFINAGNHVAELFISNSNYTFGGSKTCAYVIERLGIDVVWSWTDADGLLSDDATPYWQYCAATPEITVGETKISVAEREITFSFGYEGLTDGVGLHVVKAKITGATCVGEAVNIDNYIIKSECTTQAYEITPYVITVIWTGNAENGTYSWVYDGKTQFAPTAKYSLWDGTEYTAQVTGAAMLAGEYMATVKLPENLLTNCKFAVYSEGENSGKSCGEQLFTILRKKVKVAWAGDDDSTQENGIYYWVYDGKAHSPKAYAADDDGNPTTQELQVTDGAIDVNRNCVASASLVDSMNYEFATDSDSACRYAITERPVSVKWIDDSGDKTPAFSWYYSPNVERAPKAVITNADGTEFKIDGKLVYAIVSGGAIDAGEYLATASIASNNYALPAGTTYTQKYYILRVEFGENDFRWENGTEKDGWYEYEFDGTSRHPTAFAKGSVEFAYEYYAVNADDKTQMGGRLAGITNVGTYKVTATVSNNKNYAVPSALTTVYVKINPKKLAVKWSTEKLVYNGANQKPEAYYEDVNGNTYLLDVAVTEATHKDAGAKYSATASFKLGDNVKNYVLDDGTTTRQFEISRRSIRIEWGNVSFIYDGAGHRVDSKVYLSDALPADMSNIGVYYVILDKDGNEIDADTVIDAGTYKMQMCLDSTPDILKNYIIVDTDDSDCYQTFEIVRRKIIVTVDDCEAEYLEDAPAFTATYGKEVENDGITEIMQGFIGADGEDTITGLVVGGVRPWIACEYVSGYTPATYDITVDEAMLSAILKNYDVECHGGKLTVTAADGSVIWYGDPAVGDPDFEYDGKEHKPDAYLKGSADPLKVVYVDKDGKELKNFKAKNSGTYYAKAIAPEGVEITKNQIIAYEIKPRELLINVHRFELTYGDRQVSADGSDILTADEIKTLWSFGEGSSVVEGDDLQISLIWNVKDSIKNGFLNAGTYYIEGRYNDDHNYKLIFEGVDNAGAEPDKKQFGLYVVNKADIRDESKQGTEWFYEESVIEKYEKYFIRIEDKITDEETGTESYEFVKFAGDQTAQASFAYSKPYLVGRDEIPMPDENESYPNLDKNNTGISDKGIWIINYKIEIPNHNTYYGRWTVLIKLAEEYVIVIFVKPYEIEYGADIPKNLTEQLVDGGYVEISGAVTDKEYFKQIAEAYIPLGYNKYVTNRTKVGAYNPCFRLTVERGDDEPELDVIYRKNNHDEDSNLGMYVIVPRQITVVWGPTEFTYDKAPHVPTPVLGNWINNELFVLEGIENGKVYETTDAGATVKITVTTEGNFKSTGGHKIMLTIDDPNYVIAASDAVQVISIEGTFPWWLIFMLGALAATAITVFITLIIKLKHRNATIAGGVSDGEGFYDPLDTPDEAGFDDPISVPNDGFDYDNMWNDYIS